MLNQRRWVYSIIIFMIIFTSFGCFSMSYFVDLDSDGSGKGKIYHKVIFPDIGESGASALDSHVAKLNKEGWENIEFSATEDELLQLTADYTLDPASGRGLPESMKKFTIIVEEAENGYKYFTMNGAYDYTELQKNWQEIKNAESGSVDLGKMFGGEYSAVNKEDIDALIQKYGEPKVEFKIRLPGNTPVDAKGTWNNLNDYMNGKTDIIEFIWTPDKRPTGTLMVSRRWEPKVELTEDQINQNLAELFVRYQQEIPIGWNINMYEMPTAGWFNNFIFAHFDNEAYTCGSYQNYVMDFLDQIRTNPDPEINSVLNGLDYGPIQTNGGGHVAVVVYPSGSDWTQTGTVFDPWPTQRPETYNINTWFLNLGLYAYSGYSPEVSYGMENAYPHLSGKPPSYPAQVDLEKNRAQPVRQILVINSPVTVLLKMEDGSFVGVNPDGTATNQKPVNVSFYTVPKENGEHAWFFMLPDQLADVSIYGQDEGLVHMALVSQDKIMAYEPQRIQFGESLNFSIQPEATLSPLQLESGTSVEPVIVNQEKFLSIIGVAEPVDYQSQPEPEENIFVPEPPYDEDDSSNVRIILFMIFGLCCCFVVILVVVVTIVVLRRRQK
jgi:hypothetical protein